jgi:hypothetical protein
MVHTGGCGEWPNGLVLCPIVPADVDLPLTEWQNICAHRGWTGSDLAGKVARCDRDVHVSWE